jgi:hypothetical protein
VSRVLRAMFVANVGRTGHVIAGVRLEGDES